MAVNQNLIDQYRSLSPDERHLIQLGAVYHQYFNRTELFELSDRSGWSNSNGMPLAYNRALVDRLLKQRVLVTGKQNKIGVNLDIEISAIHDAIREGVFDGLAETVTDQKSRRHDYSNYDRTEGIRDLRIAFYSGDFNEFQLARRRMYDTHDPASLCAPFERDIFDQLDPQIQTDFLVNAIDCAVLLADTPDLIVLDAVAPFVLSNVKRRHDLTDAWISLATARGDFTELKQIREYTDGDLAEVDGCIAFLRGQYDKALQYFDAALQRVKGKSKKNAVLKRLPGILHVMLLVRENSATATKKAKGMINVAKRQDGTHYSCVHEALQGPFAFRDSGTNVLVLYEHSGCEAPISRLTEGWLWQWFASDTKSRGADSRLKDAADGYRKLELHWLAAEADGLAGRTTLQAAPAALKRSQKWFEQHKVRSLLQFIEPIPDWARRLEALTGLAALTTGQQSTKTNAGHEQRMIWQISTRHEHVSIQPVLQKLTKGGKWSGGRNVALKRIFDKTGTKEFDFLTEQDRQVCLSVRQDVEYGGWGRHRDVYYHIDREAALPALAGHPLIFRDGDVTTPIELVQQQPKLVLTRLEKDGLVRLTLEPAPKGADDDLAMIEDTPQRVSFVVFEKQHHRLSSVIGNYLDVPAGESTRVLEAAQSLANVATLHSEIGGAAATAQQADARLHLHLFPWQAGLRAEFFVRPFAEAGPFLHPGQGGENVFATIDGQSRTARRDLKAETRTMRDFIAGCPTLQQFEDDDGQFRTNAVDETLELMLSLQTPVEQEQLVLHWPRGESFKVAGEAQASNFRVSIKKDRDWFAASGSLQVNPDLALDLMQLLELLDGSTSRFVKLENGQFLALTDQLRRQLNDLAAFGERMKTKLRFPPVRAAALEELGDVVSLKADKHWTSQLTRMREAGELEPKVPSTLQAELRDYQVEGFEWLARLAHWGVGGCLADDMGLGKTVEALAILLERAGDGPALVVAPTSVTFNWIAEGQRFAPTLNMHQFGTGDRDAIFEDLGPRDVVIASYGLLYSETERFQSVEWNTVILDEAQAIKNMATKRSQAAMNLNSRFRMIMTGTPLENHVGELWNLFHFINPGLLGSWEKFRVRFALPIEQNNCRDARRRLKKLIQPFILRRTKSQVLEELPPRTEVTLKVTLSDEEAAFYEALRLRAVAKLTAAQDDDQPQHLKVLAELMRLRRACCHPQMVMPESTLSSSKLALFNETLDELLDNRHKVLVFSQFVDHLTLIRAELDRKQVVYQYLDGSTPVKQRQKCVEAFQSGEGDVFLISLRAGGTGLNLTAADYVIHMDPWWNPAVEDQAADRAHRLGQTRPVTIYRLITEGTIEEKIVEMHRTKRDLADSLLEGTDMSARLSTDELLNLLKG
jgi:superfamily II DNA or RNA helicase